MRYKQNAKRVILSFGLGDSVAVNSIVGIPTIKTWRSMFDFESNVLVARGINTKFPMIYEATKQGLPPGITFSPVDFVRPMHGSTSNAIALLTNLSEDINSKSDDKQDTSPSTTVTQISGDGCIRRQVKDNHIEWLQPPCDFNQRLTLIHTIKTPQKVWRPKPINKYIPPRSCRRYLRTFPPH